MKNLLIAGFMIAAVSSGSVMYANPAVTSKPAANNSKRVLTRAEKARRQIAADLHARGSNIPPAFSADGKWSR
jgi:hypothetical protein